MSTKLKLRPLNDQVLVKRCKAETTSPGGIVIPDTAKEKMNRAEVLAVGPGRYHDEQDKRVPIDDVKPGDVVWFGKYTGTEVELDGDKLFVLRYHDLLGVET